MNQERKYLVLKKHTMNYQESSNTTLSNSSILIQRESHIQLHFRYLERTHVTGKDIMERKLETLHLKSCQLKMTKKKHTLRGMYSEEVKREFE